MKARVKHAMSQDGMEYHLYKIKFCNGASVRKELFEELKNLLDRMKDLLDTSDKETQLVSKRATVATSSAIDTAICSFFIQANKLFRALASAWNCYCHQQHCVQLLLEHRTDKKSEFEVVFAKSLPSSWEVRQTRIVEGKLVSTAEQPPQAKKPSPMATLPPSDLKAKQPLKSALRTTGQKHIMETGK